jgi:predicted NBD/HSP70 family sugar kinase
MPKASLSRADSAQILQLIRSQGSLSRAQIAETTGTSPFLASKICHQLLEQDFIIKAGQGDSTGGRRATLLSLRPGFGRLIGVHLGTVNVRAALTDFRGNLIGYVKDRSHATRGPETAMRQVMRLIDQLLSRAGLNDADLDGLGIGVSGVLDKKAGMTLFWPKLPLWTNVPVKRTLEERYGDIVEVEDTSRTQALAEYHLGGASPAKHFIYIAVGAGIGAALFLNGQMYSGAAGFAGEFGHITASEQGPVCSCGNRGCLETMVSASALIRRARSGLATGLSNTLAQIAKNEIASLSVEMLGQAARDGDRFSLRLLSETGSYLGRAMVALINLLNPELIVIGGGVASAVGDLILPEIERVVRDRAMIQVPKTVKIRISTLGEESWALGPTLLVADHALARTFLKSKHAK